MARQKFIGDGEDAIDVDWEDLPPSKSSLKRRMSDLQALADAISKLKEEDLSRFSLPDSLLGSLRIASRLKSSNAKNRQIRHASKLLDKCGEETISELTLFFEERQKQALGNTQRHKTIERWRDSLVENPNKALANLIQDYPHTERQEIRTLVRLASKEKNEGKASTQQRKLFCYLRDKVIE